MQKRFQWLHLLIQFILCVIFILGLTSCKQNPGEEPPAEDTPGENPSPDDTDDGYPKDIYTAAYPTVSKVGISMEVLGTVKRQLPEVSDEGLGRYPVYGQTLASATAEEKQAILSEDSYLRASSSTYDSMDGEGNLYLNGEATGRRLYKHTAAEGMYCGNVSDDEEAVIKRITIQSRPAGNHLTGLYAPAGEVVKVEMSEEDFAATGGLIVYIGQVLANGQPNNIWAARDFNRMPVIVNTMTTKDATAYVGSYLGGPIYVRPVNAGTDFSVVISGAVPYSHFILGYTTEEEFELNRKSSAPYFDMEVWDACVRHSGPKAYAYMFDYEDIYKTAVLWEKISTVSTKVPSGSNKAIGIDFLYDPFVAAGSMVAFVGRNTVNCPLSSMTAALNYDSFVTSGAWGNIHEYNHHFQKYGLEGSGSYPSEVTNNAVSLVSYSLFTKISSGRSISAANEGLSGWNRYTNPSWVLQQTNAASSSGASNTNLDTYANVLHSFGQDAFIRAAQYGKGAIGVDIWFKALCDATHYDMTYYFTELLHLSVSEEVLAEAASLNYPMYVPIATIYQTGAGYIYNGSRVYVHTVQPYEIAAGKSYELDLGQSIRLPEGFTYEIQSITSPKYGTLTSNGNMVYTYTPDTRHSRSGQMILTLKVMREDSSFAVENVELLLELKQTQENTDILERTTYTYTAENMYTSVEEAVSQNYAGYAGKTEGDNLNPTQNGNAEIWGPEPNQNAIMEIRGKIYIAYDGRYRIALRGRRFANLYVSLDGESYELAASLENMTEDYTFDLTDNRHYRDYELKKGQYVYFKAVLLVTYSRSFVGVGLGMFQPDNTVNVSYLNAYRNSYEREEFTTDYFYPKEYSAEYTENYDASQKLVEVKNYTPWDETYDIENLFDENPNNFIHSRNLITEDSPFELTADLGKSITTNHLKLVGYNMANKAHVPTSFTLYGGTTLEDMKQLGVFTGLAVSGQAVEVSFAEESLRYYRLVVTDTSTHQYVALNSISFSYHLSGGNLYAPGDSRLTYKGNWEPVAAPAEFGQIYTGRDVKLEFEFTGTHFAVYSYVSPEYNCFEILIDGEFVYNVDLSRNDGETKLVYFKGLPSGVHHVTIQSHTYINIAAVAVWQ